MSLVDTYRGRDTDADWKALGQTDPYWAVLNAPQFRRGVMVANDREAFYKTGRDDVGRFARMIEGFTGRAPQGGRSLDFGCGCGRLTEAMADYVDQAYGYDISEGMVNEARARSGRPVYATVLPDGPFDWINSHIVFQHIPPAKGMEILEQLLERLAPGGAVSLQFAFEAYGQAEIDTAWRMAGAVLPAAPPASAPAPARAPAPPRPPSLWTWTRWVILVLINPDTAPPRPSTYVPPEPTPVALPPRRRRFPTMRPPWAISACTPMT